MLNKYLKYLYKYYDGVSITIMTDLTAFYENTERLVVAATYRK